MERIAIYGKGGIGKSTISTNISACYSTTGKKVLQIGCDPKRDSTKKLLNGKEINPFMNRINEIDDFLDISDMTIEGFNGIECIESGGPIPGTGCAGRGISKMFETFEDVGLMESSRYDVILFDVLGDVVCGGFASPLRLGFGEKIFIVISEELMSMYACNNICRAVLEYSDNGIYVGGVIVNARDNELNRSIIESFVKKINLDIISWIPRSDTISFAEYKSMSLAEYAPDSEIINKFYELNNSILSINKDSKELPSPMDDHEFEDFFKNIDN